MAHRRMLILSVIGVISVAGGKSVIHKRDVANAIVHLMNCGADLSDRNGLLNVREPPWGSLRDVLFTNVDSLRFSTGTRHLRFSRLTGNPSLADPTSEEIVKLTDTDIRSIARLTALEYLDLQETNISDEWLVELASLPRLRMLYLGPQVTTDGVETLQRFLPGCVINY